MADTCTTYSCLGPSGKKSIESLYSDIARLATTTRMYLEYSIMRDIARLAATNGRMYNDAFTFICIVRLEERK